MALLNDLPNELLLQITEHLKGQFQALARLCLVSRRWKEVATSTLYTGVALYTSPKKFHTFVRTLLTHDDLTRHVKIFECLWDTRNGDLCAAEEDKIQDEPKLVGSCAAQIMQMAVPVEVAGHLTSNLARGQRSAFTAIILHLLPKLERLSIRVTDPINGSRFSFRNDLLRVLYGIRHDLFTRTDLCGLRGGLQHLTHLCIPFTHFNLLRFFYLPNLRALKLDLMRNGIRDLGSGWLNHVTTPIASKNGIEDLTIQSNCCELEPSSVHFVTPHIIRCLHIDGSLNGRRHTLKHVDFRLTFGGGYYCGARRYFQTLVSHLAAASTEIESLRIDIRLVYCDWETLARYLSSMRPVTTLSGFGNLRNLEVPQEFLIDRKFRSRPHPGGDLRHLLPSKIESLTIICPDGMAIVWLHKLSLVLNHFNALLDLALECVSGHGRLASWFHKRRDPVFDTFRDRGICVRIYDAKAGFRRPQAYDTVDAPDLRQKTEDPFQDSLDISSLFGEDVGYPDI